MLRGQIHSVLLPGPAAEAEGQHEADNMLRNFISSFIIAFESLASNKVRATLTMLGIIIGVAAVITMTAIGQGAKKAVTDQIATLGTNLLTIYPGATFSGGVSSGTGGSNKLTESDAEAMKKLPTISAVASPRFEDTRPFS